LFLIFGVLVYASVLIFISYFCLYYLVIIKLKKKKKKLLVWAYGTIQVSRQVLARKVLGFKSVGVTPLTFLGTNLGPWRILFPLLAFVFS
jgi:hypothetical protein